MQGSLQRPPLFPCVQHYHQNQWKGSRRQQEKKWHACIKKKENRFWREKAIFLRIKPIADWKFGVESTQEHLAAQIGPRALCLQRDRTAGGWRTAVPTHNSGIQSRIPQISLFQECLTAQTRQRLQHFFHSSRPLEKSHYLRSKGRNQSNKQAVVKGEAVGICPQAGTSSPLPALAPIRTAQPSHTRFSPCQGESGRWELRLYPGQVCPVPKVC